MGESSGRERLRSYSRVVEIEECPSHIWTYAISAWYSSAMVAAVARRACRLSPSIVTPATARSHLSSLKIPSPVSGPSSFPVRLLLISQNSAPGRSSPCPVTSKYSRFANRAAEWTGKYCDFEPFLKTVKCMTPRRSHILKTPRSSTSDRCRAWKRDDRASAVFSALSSLLSPDPLDTLVVHPPPLTLRQRCDSGRPVPPLDRRQFGDPPRQCVLVATRDRRVTLHRTVLREHTARPTLGDPQSLLGMIFRTPPLARAQ